MLDTNFDPSNDAIIALNQLGIESLSETWTDNVYDQNFVDTSESWPLEEFGPEQVITALNSFLRCCQHWNKQSGLWECLASNKITTRKLLPLLHYHMDSQEHKPESAVLAATIYCLILTSKGCGAHAVFHPMVFRTVLKILGSWTKASESSKSLGSKRKASSGARPLKRRATQSSAGDDDDDDDAHEDSSETLKKNDAPTHIMVPFMKAFVTVLKSNRQGSGEGVTDDLIRALVRLTRLQITSTKQSTGSFAEALVASNDPAMLAYAGLESLCTDQSSELAVFKELINTVTMRFRTVTSGATIPKAVHLVREQCVEFVSYMLDLGKGVVGTRLLIQHTCAKVTDRAEYRTSVATSVVDMIIAYNKTTNNDQHDLLRWIAKYSRNPKVGYRNFALEVVCKTVPLLGNETNETVPKDLNESVCQDDSLSEIVDEYVAIVYQRSNDKAATVRGRAITGLAQLIANRGSSDSKLSHSLFKFLFPSENKSGKETNDEINADSTTPQRNASGSSISQEVKLGCMIELVTRRVADDKSNVRKAAVQLAETLALIPECTRKQADSYMTILHQSCMDPSLNVRKQAIGSITAVLKRYPTNSAYQHQWLSAVMPQVLDREDSNRSKCVDILESFVLIPVAGSCSEEECELGWTLLQIIDGKQDMKRYLQRVVTLWDTSKKLKPALYSKLTTHVCEPASSGGWSLLSEMAARNPSMVDASQILDAWTARDLDDTVTATHMLYTIGHVSQMIDSDQRIILVDEIQQSLVQFTCPVAMISAMVLTLTMLQHDTSASVVKNYFTKLVQACEKSLANICFSGETTNLFYDEVAVARQLFTLGEAVLTCPNTVTQRHVLIVQALAAPSMDVADGDGGVNSSRREAHAPAVRAHAFLVLGKLCLQDEELSKSTIASMAHELEKCQDPAVRNNIVFVMTDLCVRHPNFIQQYLPNIANCLRDATALVRRQTVTLLTRLLKEDYIKLRHDLFFRLVLTIVDDDEGVRNLGRFCITNILQVKDPTTCPSHIVECLFHFNHCVDHPIYNRFPQTERQTEIFDLSGFANASNRRHLYKLMLEHCTDIDRLNISQKMCQEILGALGEGTIQLTKNMTAVLQDALHVLASAEIKMSAQTSTEEEDDARVAAATKAKTNLISKLVKKNTAENIVPIVVALKSVLEKQHSPLMKNLMLYLRELMKEYKDEIADILAADKQLGNEITYDLQKFEEAEAKEKQLVEAARLAKSTPKRILTAKKSRQSLGRSSPFGSPSVFASLGSPHSPRFAAPKLRGTPSSRRRSAPITNATASASDGFASPKRTASNENRRISTLSKPNTTPQAPQNLKWVRTPSSKLNQKAGSRRTSSCHSNTVTNNNNDNNNNDDDIDDNDILDLITLPSPAVTSKPTPQWKVRPPTFPDPSPDKRDRELDEMVEESEDTVPSTKTLDTANDENHNTINTPNKNSNGGGQKVNKSRQVAPLAKRQQLSKAELRKRNLEISKLSVQVTEHKISLEQFIEEQKFFEADELKKQISELQSQKNTLMTSI